MVRFVCLCLFLCCVGFDVREKWEDVEDVPKYSGGRDREYLVGFDVCDMLSKKTSHQGDKQGRQCLSPEFPDGHQQGRNIMPRRVLIVLPHRLGL
ncbi:hypothetical protein A6070_11100 [Syntrophotalea acetylenica]|nr:hypothetical protein A6070_11100 [Syntrophotalea acetylenica]